MTKINRVSGRGYDYVRPEKGPDWMQDFFHKISKQYSVEDLSDSINSKRVGETVEEVVKAYADKIGLNLDGDISKKASDSMEEIDNEVKVLIISMLEHSQGTKSTESIIHKLKELYGKDKYMFNDKVLRDFIDEKRKDFVEEPEEMNAEDFGSIGTEDSEYFNDTQADYMEHGGANKS